MAATAQKGTLRKIEVPPRGPGMCQKKLNRVFRFSAEKDVMDSIQGPLNGYGRPARRVVAAVTLTLPRVFGCGRICDLSIPCSTLC
jgi:hypothetical protein